MFVHNVTQVICILQTLYCVEIKKKAAVTISLLALVGLPFNMRYGNTGSHLNFWTE